MALHEHEIIFLLFLLPPPSINLSFATEIRFQFLDPDTAMDLALSELLTSLSVDQNLVVEAIQLEEPQEPGPVISSTVLMVTERKCQGSDTIHLRRKTIRREYTDV